MMSHDSPDMFLHILRPNEAASSPEDPGVGGGLTSRKRPQDSSAASWPLLTDSAHLGVVSVLRLQRDGLELSALSAKMRQFAAPWHQH